MNGFWARYGAWWQRNGHWAWLAVAALNLWAGIREDALGYFEANRISWWKGAQDRPTGHLLSSQIACVNQLYPLRQRPAPPEGPRRNAVTR